MNCKCPNNLCGDVFIPGFIEIINQFKTLRMVVAEIGTYAGCTSRVAAPLVKEMNGTYIAVDTFTGTIDKNNTDNPMYGHGYNSRQKDVMLNSFIDNIKEVKCTDIVTIHNMTSLEAIEFIPDESLDICFIDADHVYKSCKADILNYIPKIKKGGILCGHDFDGGEDRFNTFSEEQLSSDFTGGLHCGVTQAIGETIGFENTTKYSGTVWATRINENGQFEKL
jgi:hypothetical protein